MIQIISVTPTLNVPVCNICQQRLPLPHISSIAAKTRTSAQPSPVRWLIVNLLASISRTRVNNVLCTCICIGLYVQTLLVSILVVICCTIRRTRMLHKTPLKTIPLKLRLYGVSSKKETTLFSCHIFYKTLAILMKFGIQFPD